jgi:hypothetical protein
MLLSDLGMLEDGMTANDKRNFWAVIRRSQDTAKAEEQNRQKQARQASQFNQVTMTGFGFSTALYGRYNLRAVCVIDFNFDRCVMLVQN